MIPKETAKQHGYDIVDGSIDDIISKLRQLLPGVVTENGKVDVKALQSMIGEKNMSDGSHRHELRFAGKGLANYLANSPADKELKVEHVQSKNFDDTSNMVIRGDNLDVLKILRQNYYGSVKAIYIDPPYNTGNDGFVYNDNFRKNEANLIDELGLYPETVDTFQDLYGTKTHSGWLAFMYPRLKVARDLLTDDGVIFISIDDNEQANLKLLCDEIFGEVCFVANFMWHSTKSITNPALVSVAHTYTITYAKNIDVFGRNRHNFKLPPILEGFHNPDNDPRGPWKADPFEAGGERPNQMYPITNPNTGEVFRPKEGNCWKNDLKRFKNLVEDERIVFGKSGQGRPQRKRFLSEAAKRGLTPNTWWDSLSTTTGATNMLKKLLGPRVFSNPKPVDLLYRVLQLSTEKDSVILDFFAGSGTTGEAVMRLNADSDGNRKFILVQLDEGIKKNEKNAFEFCNKNKLKPVISSITIERLDRAGDMIKKEHPDIDTGYKVFSLTNKPEILSDESQTTFSTPHTGRNAMDTLFNMLCATHKPLDTPIEMIIQDRLYEVDREMYVLGDVDLSEYKDRRIYVDGWSETNTLEMFLNMPQQNVSVIY